MVYVGFYIPGMYALYAWHASHGSNAPPPGLMPSETATVDVNTRDRAGDDPQTRDY